MPVVLLDPYRGQQRETVIALEELLLEAKAGQIIGLAYVVMRQERVYSVGVAGETRRVPTFTRGMLMLLDDKLAELPDPVPPR